MSHHALLSSLCGCLASVAGKAAFDSTRLQALASLLCSALLHTTSDCPGVALPLLRVLSIAALLVLNSLMLTSLVRCMHVKGTVHATTMTSALSFALSGVAGWLVWEEQLSRQWGMGLLLILGGVFLVQRGSTDEAQTAERARQRPPPREVHR